MLIRYLIIIGIIVTISVMLSCSGTTPDHKETLLDRNWGRSIGSARYMQMLNPEAEKNLDPVLGLDGNASDHNVNKYRKSFKETEQKESVTILKLQ
jgi:hypothetical protein